MYSFSEVTMSEAVVVDKMETEGLLDAEGKNSRQVGILHMTSQVPKKQTKGTKSANLRRLPSGRFPGFVKCFLRVPQLLCSFPAAQASKGNSQKIVYKTCETTLSRRVYTVYL